MNKLSLKKRTQIIACLVEGNSMRSTSRLVGVDINTVISLFVEVSQACQRFHDEMVHNLKTKRIQVDEQWAFVYAKNKNAERTGNPEAGDAWTWIALDADSRLVISWYVGKRNMQSGISLMKDLASRIINRAQLTTDGFRAYEDAIDSAFEGKIDYAKLDKIYGVADRKDGTKDKRERYLGADKIVVQGQPDIKHVSTSYVERQNLTMRMHIRRFTRKTNGFSKKLENHYYSTCLHFAYYNFVRIHKTLRVTPAMEAGIADRWMELEDLVKLVDKYENEDRNMNPGLKKSIMQFCMQELKNNVDVISNCFYIKQEASEFWEQYVNNTFVKLPKALYKLIKLQGFKVSRNVWRNIAKEIIIDFQIETQLLKFED